MKPTQNSQRTPDTARKSPTIVVVGGETAKGLATHLDETATVRFIGDDREMVRRGVDAGLDAHYADITDASSLCSATGDVDAAVVIVEPDRTALLTSQLLRTCCDIEHVITSVTDPSYRDAFAETDIHFVDTLAWLDGIVRDELSLSPADT